jgi:hypothetical protein
MIRDLEREYNEGLDKATVQQEKRNAHYALAKRRFKLFTLPLCFVGIVVSNYASYTTGRFDACPIIRKP